MENETIANFKEFKIEKDFNQAILNNFDKLFVILFYADWHEQSKYILNILKSQSKLHPDSIFAYINAENPEMAKLVEKFTVTVVPTFLFLNGSKEQLYRLENDSPQILSEKITEYEKAHKVSFELKRNEMFPKIEKIISQFPLVVFMKGTPDIPKCGFSQKLVDALRELKLRFAHYDILSDEDVRNWLRLYGKWNTYPQVWVNGKLVGGLDVTTGLIKEGKFQELVKDLDIKEEPESVANRLVGSGPVVAFFDETSEKNQGLVDLLKKEGIKYKSFEVSKADAALVKALKDRLKVETFPQLVVNKQVVDLAELAKEGNVEKIIPSSEFELTIRKKLEMLIKQKPVMLFMKGTPENPECGFSKRTVSVLNKYNADFGSFNILTNPEVRENLKEYSNWKTYPQLYIEGKLIGGCDIVEQLDEMNEFQPLVEKYQL